MSLCVADIEQWLERLAPSHLAEEWDNVGLQVGQRKGPASHILTCLTVNHRVVDQALAANTQLIVAHHPLLFRPLRSLRMDRPGESVAVRLVQENVALYVAHTNLDAAPRGMGEWLAEILDLKNRRPLLLCPQDKLQKLVVFVPLSHVSAVRTAISEAGAGHIGSYSHCTFASEGVGTFLPLAGTHPFLGKEGHLETVSESRLETVLPVALRDQVLAALRAVHPYEEVAYDLYDLPIPGLAGYGRIGDLPAPMDFAEFADMVKQRLGARVLRIAGPQPTRVARVAVLNGAGAQYIDQASSAGADVYITGDIKYHDAERAESLGLCVLDVGHFATESMAGYRLAEYLREEASKQGLCCEIATAQEMDPLRSP